MESSSKVEIGSKFDVSNEVFMSGIIGATNIRLKQKIRTKNWWKSWMLVAKLLQSSLQEITFSIDLLNPKLKLDYVELPNWSPETNDVFEYHKFHLFGSQYVQMDHFDKVVLSVFQLSEICMTETVH